MDSTERINYAKLCKAVIAVGTQVLRDALNRQITPNKLRSRLHHYRSKFKLSPHQWDCINHAPTNGYIHFDISLLYTILSQIRSGTIHPPTNGWGVQKLPEASEQSLGDDIERIRLTRNFILEHVDEKRLSDREFLKYGQVLKGVMKSMVTRFGGIYNSDLSDIIEKNISLQDVEQYIYQMDTIAESSDLINEDPSMKGTTAGQSGTTDDPPGTTADTIAGPRESTAGTPGATAAPPGPTAGQPRTTAGSPGTNASPSGTTAGPPGTTAGPPGTTAVPPGTTADSPGTTEGPPSTTVSPPRTTAATSGTTAGQSGTTDGPPGTTADTTAGPRESTAGTPGATAAPPGTTAGQPRTTAGSPGTTASPSGTTAGPPDTTAGPPGTTAVPPGTTADSPGTTEGPPSTTVGPPRTTTATSDLHQRIVSGWKVEDEVFTETRASKSAYTSIRKNDVITIAGNFGMGKSAIAHHCALRLEREGYIIYPILRPFEILECHNQKQKQVFVIDDPVGIYALDQEQMFAWNKCEYFLKTCLKTDTKILFTVRKLIANDSMFKNSKSVLCKNILDLQEEKYSFSQSEKLEIFKQQLRHNQVAIPKEPYKLISYVTDQFPLLCRLFAANKYFRQQGKEFFQNPFDVLQYDLGYLKKYDKLKYCTLVLCAVYNNRLESKMLNENEISNIDREIVQAFVKACGFQMVSLVTLKKSFDSLMQIYLKLEGDCYVFIHHVVSDAILYHFAQDFPKQVLSFCPSNFVRERIRISSQPRNDSVNCDGHMILIKEDLFSDLAERLFEDIKKGNLYDVFLNPCLKYEKFVKHFSAILVAKGKTFIRDLFTSQINYSDISDDEAIIRQRMDELVLHDENPAEWTKLGVMFHILQLKDSVALDWVVAQGMDILLRHIFGQLSKDADILQREALLQLACLSGNASMFREITVDTRIIRFCDVKNALVLLECACLGGNVQILKLIKTFYPQEQSSPQSIVISSYAGNTDMLELLITHYTDLNKCNFNGISPVYAAAKEGHIKVLELLIQHGADINKCDNNGVSPVYVAAKKGHINALELLIQNHTDFNKCDNSGLSPVYVAALNGHINALELLIQHHADINKCDNNDVHPVFVAAQEGHINVLELLIQHHADIHKCDNDGVSPVYVAAQNGHIDVLELLIQHHADINKCDNRGVSPVYVASQNGHINVLEILIQHHADINTCDNRGVSPVYVVAQNGHLNALELLIQHHADINKCHTNGVSPVYVAALNGHTPVLELLIQHHADINKCDNRGVSPVYVVAQNGHINALELLIQHHADINKFNCNGVSPVRVAAQNGHINVLELLIKHHAYIKKCNNNGVSPVYAAALNGHTPVLELLIKHHADIKKCNNNGVSPVYVAAQNGHINALEILIQHHADVNTCDNRGVSPVYVSAQNGHINVLELLIQHHADINKCNYNGVSPVYVTAQNGHTPVLELLLQHHADINKCDNRGVSPVYAAALNGHTPVLELLIQNHADVNKCNNRGVSPVFVAALNGLTPVLELLIQNHADVNKCNNRGVSPVFVAAQNGHINILKLLIQHHADINKCNLNGVSPVSVAAQNGHINVVELLIQHHVDINKCNYNGVSVVYVAALNGHTLVLELLIHHHADINKCDDRGASPVYVAAQNGHINALELLIQHYADINKCDDRGASPMYVAAQNGHINALELLIQHYADINNCDDSGASPVYVAALNGHINALELLIQHHADINKCDNRGVSPVYVAALNGHINALELLIQHHADINKCDNRGISPVYVAAQNGHINVLELLTQHHADINKCNDIGVSPVHVAAQNGHINILELLIQHHADINKGDNNDISPVIVAAQAGHFDVLKLLMQHFVDIYNYYNIDVAALKMGVNRLVHQNVTDAKSDTKDFTIQQDFFKAVKENDIENLMFLCTCGADVNAVSKEEGKYAIHFASEENNVKTIETLISLNSLVNATDAYGRTALHYVCELGFIDAAELLLSHNANVSAVDDEGKSALSYGVKHNKLEIVKILLSYDANLLNVDKSNKRPLHYAIAIGNEAIIKLLACREQELYHDGDIDISQFKLSIETSCDFLGTLVLQRMLANYFKQIGEGLESLVVRANIMKILRTTCTSLENKLSKNIVKVWAAYKNPQEGPVLLIVYVTDFPEKRISSYFGLEVRYYLYNLVHEEATIVTNSQLEKDSPILGDTLQDIINAIDSNAKYLRAFHSNLTMISSSSVKSSNMGANLKLEKCIVLYCRNKGMIPFGEENFPAKIERFRTDIREGYIILNSSVNGQRDNPPPCDRHKVIRMGCSIGLQGNDSSGTLGGFIDWKEKLHFLTCSHVLFDASTCGSENGYIEFSDTDGFPKVCQPGDGDAGSGRYSAEERVCGKVVKAVFNPIDRPCSVDAALVEINEKRDPKTNQLIGLSKQHVKECGFDDVPDMSEMYIMGNPIGQEHLDCRIFKVGARTGITRGVLRLDGTQVFTSLDEAVEFTDKSRVINIRKQITVLGVHDKFFLGGDSGSLVFIRINDKNYCLGLAIASDVSGKCLVTPIKDVLDALELDVTHLNGYVP